MTPPEALGVPDAEVRARIRAARRAIGPAEASRASRLVAVRVSRWIDREWSGAKVGSYVAFDGELDPSALGERLRSGGHSTWLPVCEDGLLRFRRWDGRQRLVRGPFGTSHPELGETVDAYELDVVLVPLVAFDAERHRVGFGAGFYDRTFAEVPRPVLIGLAHDLQELEPWRPEAWDVTLDAVATPSRWVIGAGPDDGRPQAEAIRSA